MSILKPALHTNFCLEKSLQNRLTCVSGRVSVRVTLKNSKLIHLVVLYKDCVKSGREPTAKCICKKIESAVISRKHMEDVVSEGWFCYQDPIKRKVGSLTNGHIQVYSGRPTGTRLHREGALNINIP